MTSQPTPRKFTPLEILNRGCEYGITISLDGDHLVIDIPPNLEQGKKDKALSVIQANKPEILGYLRSLEESVPICYECLNEDLETPCNLVGPDDLMYCQRHYDKLNRMLGRVEE